MADLDSSKDAPQIDWEAFYANYRKPDFIAGYEILHKLGAGAFGLVFKARKHSIGKDYAIKFLKVDDASVRDAVLHELDTVRLFAQIDHPNLVSIEDMGHASGIPYIVMGYAGDDTLARRLQDGKLARPEALRILLQVCRGVQALHERMLVHFDLKPANVYLKDSTARVGDYGLSKLVTASRRSLSFGRGTTYYMAPEVLQRQGDHRSDVYSLGVMLYECLVGHVPFLGDSEWEILKKHETEAPVYPADLAPADRDIIDACLRKDPEQRVQSVVEVMAALQGTPGTTTAPASARRARSTPLPPLATAPAPAPGTARSHAPRLRRTLTTLLLVASGMLVFRMLRMSAQPPSPATAASTFAEPSGARAFVAPPAPDRPRRELRADRPPHRNGAAETGTASTSAGAAAEADDFRNRLDAAIDALQRLREVDVLVPDVRAKALSALGSTLRNLDLKGFRGQDPWKEALVQALKAGLENREVRDRWTELVETMLPEPARR